MPASAEVDTALVAKLAQDAALTALLPNGVYMDEAPPGSTRFVIVSLADHHDVPVFGGRALESSLYLVKAVALSTAITPANAKAAEARIDALLDPLPPLPPATLEIPGYTFSAMYREERLRKLEPDEKDPSLRWAHRGGWYRVEVSLGT